VVRLDRPPDSFNDLLSPIDLLNVDRHLMQIDGGSFCFVKDGLTLRPPNRLYCRNKSLT
jgi:hypothetical protein